MMKRLILPLALVGGLSQLPILPVSAQAPATAQTQTVDQMPGQQSVEGGIAKRQPGENKIVQYYGADMNDVEVTNMWSVPFMVLAALLLVGLAAYFVLQRRYGGGFADHFGR